MNVIGFLSGLWSLDVGGFQEASVKKQCNCTHQVSTLTVSRLGSRSLPLYAFVSTVTSSKELCITYLFADYIKHPTLYRWQLQTTYLLVLKALGKTLLNEQLLTQELLSQSSSTLSSYLGLCDQKLIKDRNGCR